VLATNSTLVVLGGVGVDTTLVLPPPPPPQAPIAVARIRGPIHRRHCLEIIDDIYSPWDLIIYERSARAHYINTVWLKFLVGRVTQVNEAKCRLLHSDVLENNFSRTPVRREVEIKKLHTRYKRRVLGLLARSCVHPWLEKPRRVESEFS
jgi:hypothetical protein